MVPQFTAGTVLRGAPVQVRAVVPPPDDSKAADLLPLLSGMENTSVRWT